MTDPKTLHRLAWAGTALTFALIALGGIVRITGSGLGCGEHWPRCNGQWFPPLDLPTFIEISHRWTAALVSLAVAAVALVAWRRHRDRPDLFRPATAAFVLLVIQVLLGAVTVKLTLPPAVVVTHLVTAMLILASLSTVALRSGDSRPSLPRPARHRLDRFITAAAWLGFLAVFLGAEVANLNAAAFCRGVPLCDGGLAPPDAGLGLLHWTHRVVAYTTAALLLGILWRIARDRGAARLLWPAIATAIVVMLQIGIGVAMMLTDLPTPLRAAHVAAGTGLWLALLVLSFRSHRQAAGR